jgi:hypothetical protein
LGLLTGPVFHEVARVLCRIDCRHEPNRYVVRLAGRFGEAHVPDLLAACAQATNPVLELDDLMSADEAGLDALLRVERQGARLSGLPEYLRLKLETLARDRVR